MEFIIEEEETNTQIISESQIDKSINQFINELGRYNENIKTKLKNIDKAGVDTIPCSTLRVSQNSRIYITREIVKQNNLTLEQLNTHKKGICVGITWDEYEKMKTESESESLDDELDKYLFNHIGSDNNVSCIVAILKEKGYSGSSKERQDKIKLDQEAIFKNWFPIRRKLNINTNTSRKVNEGNDKWEGHYYYSISGGEQETMKSWTGKEPQLFTTHKGFITSDQVMNANYVSLLYMIIHVHDIHKAFESIHHYKTTFENYLKQSSSKYLGKSSYNSIMELPCIINKNRHLISPILCKPISIDDFCKKHALNISHNVAVSKNIILFCDEKKVLLSDYRPGNLFWDFKHANMRQQDDTIQEYWEAIEQSIELRKNL